MQDITNFAHPIELSNEELDLVAAAGGHGCGCRDGGELKSAWSTLTPATSMFSAETTLRCCPRASSSTRKGKMRGEPLLHTGERFSTALCGFHPQPWRGG